MMHTFRIGEGPNSVEMSFSDVYTDPLREYRQMQESWERMESARWCPMRKPSGWWWRKWVSHLNA